MMNPYHDMSFAANVAYQSSQVGELLGVVTAVALTAFVYAFYYVRGRK